MSSRIIYDSGTAVGAMLSEAVDKTSEALAALRRVKAILDAAQYGDPADWAAVAVEVGGGLTVQQAQDLWTILSTAVSAIDVTAVAELSKLDQG